MAFKRLTIDGYGQVELNNCAFRRDGRIEAQCKPDPEVFGKQDDGTEKFIENGMILAVDNVNRTITTPDGELPVALVYSTEHLYDERYVGGLRYFKTAATDDFYPRLGYLDIGDKYTTNCLGYDDGEFTDEDTLLEALAGIKDTAIYGKVGAEGVVTLTATKPTTGPVLKVVKSYTMPDGQFGVKLQVIG